ncbi:hypothetical protein MtrunA17_Chr7g0262271 [Medicago truncatula]|uniref:Uncharacterized protein n=1 Tax=Medicago truncatula TaxID=3880 RepID=A0A396HBI1_MEDTR|nr:hypothetical protein MtrunA17_Chr7g0262271 [Medicago truncatula]
MKRALAGPTSISPVFIDSQSQEKCGLSRTWRSQKQCHPGYMF